MGDLQQKLAQLSAEQKALLLKKLAAKKAATGQTLTISPRDKNLPVPMAFAQQRLWFLQRYTGSNSLYNLPVFLHMHGRLDITAMEKAFALLIARHEVLRTQFYQTDEGTFQRILPADEFKLGLDDLSDIEHQDAACQQILQAVADTHFDLEQGPLFQLRLLRLNSNEHILASCVHHIISDGWSVDVFMRDFAALYQAEAEHKPAQLAELPIQYADYACWQQQQFSLTENQEHISFWQAYLQDVPYFLDLPLDFIRPKTARHNGALYEVQLDCFYQQGVQRLSRQQQVSEFAVLFSAFALLLARFSGQDKLLIGTPLAGRQYKELENLIGFFVNSLPVKFEYDPKLSFAEFLQLSQQSFLQVTSHQQFPFEKIVETVKPERNESFSPLYQVMFTYANAAGSNTSSLAGLQLDFIAAPRTTAKFDLTLSVQAVDNGLSCLMEYDTDQFKGDSIQQLMICYQRLLQAVIKQPETQIQAVSLLSDQERRAIVYDWNDCASDYPRQNTVIRNFKLQVNRAPDNLAIIHNTKSLTYQQLDQQANQLAHLLMAQGLQAGDYVALYLQRSCDLVVSMLAVLKAGAAYLPLDLAYPLSRLSLMFQSAKVVLTISQQCLQKDAEQLTGTGLLILENLATAEMLTTDPVVRCCPQSLAYTMYTSGSTGIPKGINISHAAINRLALNSNYIDIRPGDRIAQVSNTAFDAATFEIWGALLNGAGLVIADRDVSLSVDDFVGFLQSQNISILFLTTALFNQIVQQQPNAFSTLNYLLFGGEAVDPEQVKKVLEYGKPQHFLHVYGPTESTSFSTWFDIKSLHVKAATVPIGSALSNTRLYVLDKHLNIVPAGVAGELYIAGEGLASGYLNQPGESAEKFVPDPFSVKPGERMYRSGDIVRWNAEGAIEFIGRVDHQVKIRGFRIELSAIETELNAQPGIKQSYVKVSQPAGQSKQLLAYFSVLPDTQVDSDCVRQQLLTVLPEYMVPAALIQMEELPLNPNGKIDAKALPAPSAVDFYQQLSQAAETDTERLLAEIWHELLGVEIYRESDFFLSGGHSLLAMQLVNRIHHAFAVKLPIREIFQNTQLYKLAKAIEDCVDDTELALISAPKQASYPLSFAQERLYFLQQLYPDSHAYNMLSALKITGALDVDKLQTCLNQIIQRHSALRTFFVLEKSQPVQIIIENAQLVMQQLDWQSMSSDDQQQAIDRLLAQEAGFSFKLDQFPLIRVQLIKLKQQQSLLVINNHHILSDGWSQQVFINELLALYQSDLILPDLPVQYVDYALWQRKYLTEEKTNQLLAYWRQQLADMPPALNLHPDFAREDIASPTAATESFTLDDGLTERVKQLAEREQCSVFTLLLAGFQLFLARYSGQSDIAVGTPVANREHQATENLIGFFVNTLVLRNQLKGEPSFNEYLCQVKNTVLDAFTHQQLAFEKLVEALQPERDLAGTPFFQVMFIYHNTAGQQLELSGLEIEPIPMASKEAKFDLTLAMHESEGKVQAVFEYNADLFKPESIQMMAASFSHYLAQLVKQPETSICSLSILPDAQYQKVVYDWNRCSDPMPEKQCLHDLFQLSVKRVPEHIAVEHRGKQLSYQQLNDQADQLAAFLTTRGAGPEVMIGLCLKRSPTLIVAMLAILKTGAAYVPLDPDYPSARLESTLQDANVLMLLTESDLAETHASLQRITKVLLDKPLPQVQGRNNVKVRPDNLAYILYTSGSTGRPKGVAITHASAVTMINWAQRVYSSEQLSRVLAGTSVCFDLSVYEIFLTLASGGTIVLLRNVIELAECSENTPSLINTVPSAAEELLRADAIPESVKTVNLAGEPLATELVNKLYAKDHIEQVFDLYGPSEDTTYSTYTLRQADIAPTIGRPISHTQAYVLDSYMQPVPISVPGELYLGGLGLARGYHDRPALTAEKFVPDPFSQQLGARLYKTGDLVNYNHNGELVYRGRLDHQVKVRGFRIELGEVEALFSSQPEVDECLVLTLGQAASSDRKLVAYIKSPGLEQATNLQDSLYKLARQQLPGFMVPAAIVILDHFPLTPNGKVDRKALPDPELKARKTTDLKPQGFVQNTLAGIWRELLELEHLPSVDDDFFDLGGHSLLVLDLMTQIKVALGKTLPLAAIFQAPTISALSRQLDADNQQTEWTPLVEIQSKGSQPPVFCIHPVGGHVICYNDLAKALGDDQPVYGLKAPGMEVNQPIFTQLPEMAAYYLDVIKSRQKTGPYRLLGYSFGGLVAYEIARLLEIKGEKIEFIGLLDTAHPALTEVNAAKTDDAELLVSLFPDLGYTAEQLRLLSPAEQLQKVFAKAKEAGLVPRAMDDKAIERYFTVCRSNLKMSYQPEPVRTPVCLIRAKDGSRRITDDDFLGWQQLDELKIDLHWVNGQHESMMETDNAEQIAQIVNVRG